MFITFYISVVYGILYLTFEAYPISFQEQRLWSPGLASLPFLSILIGIIIACASLAIYSRTYYVRRLKARGGKVNPEDRLPPMIVGSVVLPAGLFWFAWTSSPDITWVPQVLAGVCIGCGIVLIFMAGMVYIVDVYLINASSAMAVNNFIRALTAAGFPLFAPAMYHRLGVDWSTSLIAFICLAIIPFPILLYLKGQKIRGWSTFSFELGK